MAKYDYKCDKCNKEEVIEKEMKYCSREEKCNECDTVMRRIYTPTPNKWNCSGAYVTDNR